MLQVLQDLALSSAPLSESLRLEDLATASGVHADIHSNPHELLSPLSFLSMLGHRLLAAFLGPSRLLVADRSLI